MKAGAPERMWRTVAQKHSNKGVADFGPGRCHPEEERRGIPRGVPDFVPAAVILRRNDEEPVLTLSAAKGKESRVRPRPYVGSFATLRMTCNAQDATQLLRDSVRLHPSNKGLTDNC